MFGMEASLRRLCATLVVAASLGGTLALIPTGAVPPWYAGRGVTALPITGETAGARSLRQPEKRMDAAEVPVLYTMSSTATVYAKYVPPPPPDPAPAPAWVPPAGYTTIGVPIYRQTRNLNCETGALQMGLAAFGHYYSQDALFAPQNPDLRAPEMGPNKTVIRWGDPYTNFVGDVNGNDTTPTGYGVYYPVILSIARSHGLPNSYGGEGFSPATIYAELAAGHPVEVWIETNFSWSPYKGVWTAWDGRKVRYSLWEHAVTLSGISAWSVRVNDPLRGTQYWVSKGTFETSWADFNNMAVVFR
jgi:uncharacterized protein YvpB